MRASAVLATLALLSGCSDLFAPDRPALRMTVAERFVQPTVELVTGDRYAIYRTRTLIDVEVQNTSTKSVLLPICGYGSSVPAFVLERTDGSASRLQPRLICGGGSELELSGGDALRFTVEQPADLFCGEYSDCPMSDPTTWGYHRLRLFTDAGTVVSNQFFIRSPIIWD
jgi:hypothetical protein